MKIKVKDDKIDWNLPDKKIEYKKEHKVEIQKWKDIFDLDNFNEEFRLATEEMARCEIAHRAYKRSKFLKDEEKAKQYGRIEKQHHEQSIKKLNNSLNSFKSARMKIKPDKLKDLEKVAKEEKSFEKMKVEYNKAINESILEMDLTVEETEELMAISNESLEYFKKHGFNKSLDKIESNLNELSALRSNEEKNRGREHRSPLAWWKWLVWGAWLMALVSIYGALVYACVYVNLACGWLLLAGIGITKWMLELIAYIWSIGC